jgi:hypothetical protein
VPGCIWKISHGSKRASDIFLFRVRLKILVHSSSKRRLGVGGFNCGENREFLPEVEKI